MYLKDIDDLMNMSLEELSEYSDDLDWIMSCGVTAELAADIEYIEEMIEVEIAHR